jgi:hypothetical protein
MYILYLIFQEKIKQFKKILIISKYQLIIILFLIKFLAKKLTKLAPQLTESFCFGCLIEHKFQVQSAIFFRFAQNELK